MLFITTKKELPNKQGILKCNDLYLLYKSATLSDNCYSVHLFDEVTFNKMQEQTLAALQGFGHIDSHKNFLKQFKVAIPKGQLLGEESDNVFYCGESLLDTSIHVGYGGIYHKNKLCKDTETLVLILIRDGNNSLSYYFRDNNYDVNDNLMRKQLCKEESIEELLSEEITEVFFKIGVDQFMAIDGEGTSCASNGENCGNRELRHYYLEYSEMQMPKKDLNYFKNALIVSSESIGYIYKLLS